MRRTAGVDALRGLAFLGMFVYHAAFFAQDHHVAAVDLRALGWRVFQRCIAGTFFFLVGVSLRLAEGSGARAFVGRLARVGGCALVVTLTSAVLDPGRLVRFGVLHAIFLASILGRLLLPLGAGNALLGAGLLAVGATTADARFDGPALDWLGLGTRITPTFDHQPFVMWLGVVLIGSAVARPAADALGRLPAPAALAFLGRHSLFLYMAHVPLLEGCFTIIEMMTRSS